MGYSFTSLLRRNSLKWILLCLVQLVIELLTRKFCFHTILSAGILLLKFVTDIGLVLFNNTCPIELEEPPIDVTVN